MIRPIDIRLNAAHPDLPLAEAVTYTGAPSTVLIRGVPKACGTWSITAVSVAVTYPDNTTTTRAAVESADGVWVATIPGTATSGRTASGFRILADGVDENGAAVTGYVLGFADFSVLSFTPVPAPGGTFWILRYFDAIPAVPRKGDVAVVDGVLKYYNGSAWTPFADLTNYYTKSETDYAIERVAAYYITYNEEGAAFPTRDALINAMAYYSGGELRVPTRNDYAVVLADEEHGGAEWRYIYAVADGQTTGQWEAQYPIETNDYDALANKPQINGVELSGNKTAAALWLATKADATLTERGFTEWVCSLQGVSLVWGDSWSSWEGIAGWVIGGDQNSCMPKGSFDSLSIEWTGNEQTFDMSGVTATRTALSGYQLGSQTDKPLASEAEAEALRTGKQNALTAQQLANIAAVSNALAFDATHSYAAGDPVVYNGTLYTFTTEHTGAWTGSDVSAVDIIARLAGKLDKSGGMMTGPLTIVRSGDNIKIDGSTIRFNDDDGNPTGGTISGTDGGGNVALPTSDGTLALAAANPTAGNLAALDASGNPTDAGWTAGELARCSLTTKTIENGAVTLDDRAINAVAVSSSLASLIINFPTATSGKVRDFGLRLSVASGVTTAPELVLPQGVTCENADGEVPEIGADGAATILYFTETASGVFLVKGEVVTAIS